MYDLLNPERRTNVKHTRILTLSSLFCVTAFTPDNSVYSIIHLHLRLHGVQANIALAIATEWKLYSMIIYLFLTIQSMFISYRKAIGFLENEFIDDHKTINCHLPGTRIHYLIKKETELWFEMNYYFIMMYF